MKFLIGLFYCIVFALCTTPVWHLLNRITWERKGSLLVKAKREVILFPIFLLSIVGVSGYILSIYYKKVQFLYCEMCPKNIIFLGLASGVVSMIWGYMVVLRKKRRYLIWEERNREMSGHIDIKPKPIIMANIYTLSAEKKLEKELSEKNQDEFRAKFAKKKMGKHLEAWEKKFQSKADKIVEEKEKAKELKKQKRKEDRKEQARIRKKMLADKTAKKAEKEKKQKQ